MSEIFSTITGKIVTIERGHNSAYGNPKLYVTILQSNGVRVEVPTSPDSSIAYTIQNLATPEVERTFALSRKGEITRILEDIVRHCKNCGEEIFPHEDEWGNEWAHANEEFECADTSGVLVAEPEVTK
jgi:YgiT-type zinc finger domain-containing protein